MQLTGETLATIEAAIGRARDADAALRALVVPLQRGLDLWRASILVITEGGKGLLTATWGPGDEIWEPGMEVELRPTEGSQEIVTELLLGRPVHVVLDGDDRLGLVGDVLRQEGVASGVVFPLREDGAVLGTIALASGTTDAFAPEVVTPLSKLMMRVEARLLALATATQRRARFLDDADA